MKKPSSSQKSQQRTAKAEGTPQGLTIGMDLGDKISRFCMLSKEGQILQEGQATTTKAGMAQVFGLLGRARIAIEVGTHSPWVSRLLKGLGHEVVVAKCVGSNQSYAELVRISEEAETASSWRRQLETLL